MALRKGEYIYENSISTIQYDERGFFYIKLKDTTADFNMEETRNLYEFCIQKAGGTAYKVIMDSTSSLNLPNVEAENYFYANNNTDTKIALVAVSLPMKLLLGNVVRNRLVPNVSIFDNIDSAIEWILQ